ncbi:rhodanese-like domain-containing protein [Acinetobacter rathckeae]|uniref:rhodanese-like domain-containing protein n=1 Tax=Acinetobacter rathckeae TaxID=2605272 RepID=UPI0018A30B6E|nr:rhodanese-like domain-containing protein [Acinetobacter rathckeae]MBF7687474.1 rhodanese-like domain-containing protein [Acinetobacter rathckeae]MBF7694875.1 rhodanese-like domain-containing protein [Acinetobacter rathckeae]
MTAKQLAYYEEKLNYEIDSWDLFVALNAGENIIVVDGRSIEAYTKEHIPNALNLPHRTMSEDTLAHLSKEPIYVTYCDGIGCNASTKSAYKMLALGFKVKELIGGLDWWKRDGYQTEGENAQQATSSVLDCGC